MAQQLNGAIDIEFTDAREADPLYQSGANAATNPITNFAETEDIASIKAALTAFDPFTYTQANMDILSLNDLIFAWRACRGQQSSISNYHPAQVARSS